MSQEDESEESEKSINSVGNQQYEKVFPGFAEFMKNIVDNGEADPRRRSEVVRCLGTGTDIQKAALTAGFKIRYMELLLLALFLF